MPLRRCNKCNRSLPLGSGYYQLRIAVTQGFDGVIADGGETDLKALLAKLAYQTAGVPEEILEQEVHQEFSFILCSRCREKFCANPLNLPLDIKHIPNKLSDLQDIN